MSCMISIYKITHKETGKCYIGQAQDVKKRWREHTSKSSRCRKLKNAIQKYGKDAFELKVLTTVKEESADDLETFLIKAFRCVEHGYNICSQGGTCRGIKLSEETRQKMSAAHKNMSEDTKQRMSIAHKGERNPCYGKTGEKHPMSKLTDIQREEIRNLYATGEYSMRSLNNWG